jgi:hypothetical protein
MAQCGSSPNGKHSFVNAGKSYTRMEPVRGGGTGQKKVKVQPTKCEYCGRKGEDVSG